MEETLKIILLNLVVYFRTLRYDIVIDDNCRKFHQKDLHKNWLVRLYRISKYSGHGGFPLPIEHLLTIIIHTSVCVAIYLCLGKNNISFIAALLFSVHPANNQVSIWMNGKRFGVVTLLVLLMWGLKPYGLIFYVISPIWHYAALPAIFLYHQYWWVWFLLITPLFFYKKIINKIGSRWERIPPGEIKIIRPRKLITLTKMIGYHFLHCLLPRKMSFYHMFMERMGFSKEDNDYWYAYNKDFWIGLGVSLSLIVLIVFNWGNLLGFGLFWWLLFVLMWCQFPVGLTQAVAERNYYLPNVGLCYALAYLLPDYLLMALFIYYLTKLWFYMPCYKDLKEFYRYALFTFPEHFRARAHIVQRELQEHRLFWALRDAGIGLGHHPKDCTLNILMAQALMGIGAWLKAKEYLDRAKANLIPGQEEHFVGVINSFNNIIDNQIKKVGKPPKRIKPDEVIEIKPDQIVREEE